MVEFERVRFEFDTLEYISAMHSLARRQGYLLQGVRKKKGNQKRNRKDKSNEIFKKYDKNLSISNKKPKSGKKSTQCYLDG